MDKKIIKTKGGKETMKKIIVWMVVFCLLILGAMAEIPCDKYSTQSSGNEYLPGATWQVNCTNATSVTIEFGSISYSMTKNDKVFSWDKNALPPENIYDITVTGTNGTVTQTTSIWTNIKIEDSKASRRKLGTFVYEQEQNKNGMSKTTWVLLVGIVGVLIWQLTKKK